MIEPEPVITFSFKTIHGCDSTIVVKVSPLDTFLPARTNQNFALAETSDVLVLSKYGRYIHRQIPFRRGLRLSFRNNQSVSTNRIGNRYWKCLFRRRQQVLCRPMCPMVWIARVCLGFSASTSPIQHNLCGNYSNGNRWQWLYRNRDVAVESFILHTRLMLSQIRSSCFGLNDGSINIQVLITNTYSNCGAFYANSRLWKPDGCRKSCWEIFYGCQDTVSVKCTGTTLVGCWRFVWIPASTLVFLFP